MSDKQLYSYEDVIIDPDDPRIEIGAEYYFAGYPFEVIAKARRDEKAKKLVHVNNQKLFVCLPFSIENSAYTWACLIRKKEPKKRYVPFDLSKPEVRNSLRGKWFYYPSTDSELMIDCFSHMDSQWRVHGLTADQFLNACTFLDGSPCGQEVSE